MTSLTIRSSLLVKYCSASIQRLKWQERKKSQILKSIFGLFLELFHVKKKSNFKQLKDEHQVPFIFGKQITSVFPFFKVKMIHFLA